jgi:ATP-GRASP peptide maturase of grasp-with-spasm system
LFAFFPESHAHYFAREFSKLSEFIFFLFRNKNWLVKPSTVFPNKLQILSLAAELGLKIPPTLITNQKNVVLESQFYKEQALICKSMNETTFIRNNNKVYMSYTSRVTGDQIDIPAERFPLSLFQKQISKAYEIRTFFCDGKFYSMSIFSQMDETTSVDFRKYNLKNPNRCDPYRLPATIERKLKKLFRSLDLNCGSVDLIRSDGEYYFLEINPTGQFGMLDIPCNYDLHKIVAETLIKMDTNGQTLL